MKKLSKRLSLFVCLTIIANLLVFSAPVVLASNSEAEVLYKSSFSDYNSNGSPKGWVKSGYIRSYKSEVKNDASDAFTFFEQDHNNILQIKNSDGKNLKDIIPFGKIISDGKLHISYDYKIPSVSAEKNFMYLTLLNIKNVTKYSNYDVPINEYEPYSPTDFRGGIGEHQTQILKVPYNESDKIAVTNTGLLYSSNNDTNKSSEINKWSHTDIIIDMDGKFYDVWMDGEKLIRTDGNTSKINSDIIQCKGIGFYQDGTEPIYYDNINITHYYNNDIIQMVADAGKKGIGPSENDGKLLNVSFNDSFKSDFIDSDFVITAEDGTVLNGVKVHEQTISGCVLDFSTAEGLKGNTNYNVTYNGDVKGTVTEVSAKGANATFRTNAVSISTEDDNYLYYYANEDFDEFTNSEQLPFGVIDYNYLTNGNYSEQYNKYLSASAYSKNKINPVSGKNGGNAIRLKNGIQAYYYFPRGIVTGNYTVEFDMKYAECAWSIGFAPYRNWLSTALELNNDTYLNNQIQNNSLIGMGISNDGGSVAPDLYITKSTANNHYPQPYMNGSWNVDTNIDIDSEKWAHIKLDFDMAEGNMDIYVTDESGNISQSLDTSYGAWNKFGYGIEGIYFYENNNSNSQNAYLDIDNLKIYTKNNKLLDHDFNGYDAISSVRFPYFWTNDNVMKGISTKNLIPSTTAPLYNRNASSDEGASDKESDKALKLYATTSESPYYMTMFNRHISDGQSYAVEFDLKYMNDDTTWVYGPVDVSRTAKLIGYNDKEPRELFTNSNLLAMTKNNLYKYTFNTQSNINANSSTIINGYNGTKYYEAITSDNSQTANQWRHYKIIAVPQESNTKYILSIDNIEICTFTDNQDYNKKDIAGIAFQISNPKAKTDAIDNWGITLDNIKAYICDQSGKEITYAREDSILDIEAEKLNGDTVSLMNTNEIPYSTKKITVTFSEDLDETLKKDLTPITLSNNGVTGTTTAVYDCIEDVIQLRSKNAAYPMDYTSEIDGNKFIITLNDVLSSDTTYSLHIAKNVSFASSPYSTLDKGFSRTYTGAVDPDDGFKLTSCKAVVKSGDSWKEVTSFADIIPGEANLGLKFNVTNVTGAAKNIRAVAAFYDESGELAELVNVGIFDQVIESEADAQNPILEIARPTLSEGKSYTTVKFFAWDADSSAPLKRPQTFTNVAE